MKRTFEVREVWSKEMELRLRREPGYPGKIAGRFARCGAAKLDPLTLDQMK